MVCTVVLYPVEGQEWSTIFPSSFTMFTYRWGLAKKQVFLPMNFSLAEKVEIDFRSGENLYIFLKHECCKYCIQWRDGKLKKIANNLSHTQNNISCTWAVNKKIIIITFSLEEAASLY